MGGSGSINGHLYVRGQAEDYEDWVTAGATGWGWNDVRHYLQAAPTSSCRRASRRCAIRCARPSSTRSLQARRGAQPELQLRRTRKARATTRPSSSDGRRWNATDAYLRPALKRPNLALRKRAHVTRVIFEGKRAAGVAYHWRGERRVVRAAREVILAAGAINSPQLLQLSGVGDPAHLQPLGIQVLHALPAVGQGLADHYALRIAARVRGAEVAQRAARTASASRSKRSSTLFTRRGLLASPVAHAYGFVPANEDSPRPDLQLLFAPASYEGGPHGPGDGSSASRA